MVYKALSLVIVIIIVTTGCASGPAAAPTAPATTKAPAEQAKPTTAPASATTSKPQSTGPTGTLTSAIASFGDDTLDPMLSGASNHAALIYPMFEMLANYDEKGTLVPILAESWSLSDDGKVWTLKIRRGVKFHNGDPMTAADVKFSIERMISDKAKAAATPTIRPVIAKIDAPDDSTVLITTKDVTTTLIDLLTGGIVVMPKKYIEEKGDAYFADHPVGTGPWKFVSHTASSSLDLEAVPNHWRMTPAFQKLTIKLGPEESTRLAMLKRGDVDVIEISLDGTDQLKADGFETRSPTNEAQPVLYLGGTWVGNDMPTQDIRVRQALSLAINRDELGKTFFKGFATPTAKVKMGTTSYGWDPSWKADQYDPAKAKQLLAEAGYPSKFKEPTITIWSHQNQTYIPQFVQIISGYWEAIGVKTKVTPIDFAAMRAMYIAKPVDPKIVGTAYPFGEGSQANPLMSIVNAYGSKGVNSNLNDQAWDDLYAKVLAERDESKKLQLTRQLMNDGYNHYSIITTVNVKTLYAVSKKIGQWKILTGSLSGMYEGIQPK